MAFTYLLKLEDRRTQAAILGVSAFAFSAIVEQTYAQNLQGGPGPVLQGEITVAQQPAAQPQISVGPAASDPGQLQGGTAPQVQSEASTPPPAAPAPAPTPDPAPIQQAAPAPSIQPAAPAEVVQPAAAAEAVQPAAPAAAVQPAAPAESVQPAVPAEVVQPAAPVTPPAEVAAPATPPPAEPAVDAAPQGEPAPPGPPTEQPVTPPPPDAAVTPPASPDPAAPPPPEDVEIQVEATPKPQPKIVLAEPEPQPEIALGEPKPQPRIVVHTQPGAPDLVRASPQPQPRGAVAKEVAKSKPASREKPSPEGKTTPQPPDLVVREADPIGVMVPGAAVQGGALGASELQPAVAPSREPAPVDAKLEVAPPRLTEPDVDIEPPAPLPPARPPVPVVVPSAAVKEGRQEDEAWNGLRADGAATLQPLADTAGRLGAVAQGSVDGSERYASDVGRELRSAPDAETRSQAAGQLQPASTQAQRLDGALSKLKVLGPAGDAIGFVDDVNSGERSVADAAAHSAAEWGGGVAGGAGGLAACTAWVPTGPYGAGTCVLFVGIGSLGGSAIAGRTYDVAKGQATSAVEGAKREYDETKHEWTYFERNPQLWQYIFGP